MNSIKQLVAVLLLLLSVTVMAQEKRTLTLEDLLPGGETSHNFRSDNIPGLVWWGDKCIKPDVEKLISIGVKEGKETILTTLKEINKSLKSDTLRHFYNVTFPWKNSQEILLKFTDKYIVYNLSAKTISQEIDFNAKASNLDFCPQQKTIAYTLDNNLCVATSKGETIVTNEPKGIVCGQAVHRSEFGISKGTFWSPNGKYLAFYRMDESMVTDYPLVDISERIATLDNIKYPMAGMTSHQVKVGVYQPTTGTTIYLKAGDPTNRYFTNLAWSPDETKIYLIELNRDQNQAQLVRYNAQSGEKEAVILEETHPKYVEPQQPILFLKGNEQQFIYQSQKDGFNHLYLYNVEGKLIKQLTSGNWLVKEVLGFDEQGKNLFFTSTEQGPMEQQLYKLNLKSGKRSLITKEQGMHYPLVSESGRYAMDNYSSAELPRIINLIDINKGTITNLLTAKNPYEGYAMPIIETGSIKAADGVTDLYYRIMKPADFDAKKKYPAVVYVYGGPHAQMIHNNYLWDARGWDIYMAQREYIMFTLDNRGSESRGMEFENVTFRRLGIEEGKDQVKGVEYLQSLPYVDNNRIGVHGWSFGGHMTIALMLRYPALFKVGVAGGPVIDWSYYEVMYGERYMDTPQTNAKGYEETNLKNLATNLKGHLLIIHDDNDHTCVLQHSLSFMKACVEARTYPDLFIYPGHDHNVIGRDRVHLHEKITRYFDDYLK
ncbi:MAG: S9 family peptidase [Bacteroides sp.]